MMSDFTPELLSCALVPQRSVAGIMAARNVSSAADRLALHSGVSRPTSRRSLSIALINSRPAIARARLTSVDDNPIAALRQRVAWVDGRDHTATT